MKRPGETFCPRHEFATSSSGMPPRSPEQLRAGRVARALQKDYPDVACALEYETPLQLLVATILSAQCTDKQVNLVTRSLFQKYPKAAHFAAADLGELETAIKPTGYFRNKAKSIKGCCQKLVEQHGGEVPRTLEEMVELPGVGRKTANVVLGTAYGIPSGVVVDTHVGRITQRLGLTQHKDPVKIEQDLMRLLPKKEWIDFAHRMIHHGRRICIARKPRCAECSMLRICPRIGVAAPLDEDSVVKRRTTLTKKAHVHRPD
jgi:endonuclease-3